MTMTSQCTGKTRRSWLGLWWAAVAAASLLSGACTASRAHPDYAGLARSPVRMPANLVERAVLARLAQARAQARMKVPKELRFLVAGWDVRVEPPYFAASGNQCRRVHAIQVAARPRRRPATVLSGPRPSYLDSGSTPREDGEPRVPGVQGETQRLTCLIGDAWSFVPDVTPGALPAEVP